MKTRKMIVYIMIFSSILLTGCSLGSCSAEDVVDNIKNAIDETVEGVKEGAEDAIGKAQDDIGIKIIDVPGLSDDYMHIDYACTKEIRFENPREGSKVTWSSNKKNIVKIIKRNKKNMSAKLLGMKTGKATITATVRRKGKPVRKYRCKVEVVDSDLEIYKSYNLTESGYSFENTEQSFDYPEHYRIPYDQYEETFEDMYPQFIFDGSEWGGSCFGMSVSSAMLFYRILDVEDYISHGNINRYGYTSIKKYYDVDGDGYPYIYQDPTTGLGDLIERYQISQKAVEVIRIKSEAAKPFDESSVSRAVKFKEIVDTINKSQTPFIVCFHWYDEDRKSIVGHAVVVDGWREPVIRKNGWRRIYIYDPNYPYVKYADERNIEDDPFATERCIDININDGRWYAEDYDAGDKEGVNRRDDCRIYFFDTQDFPDLNNEKLHLFPSSIDDDCTVLEYSGKNFLVKDQDSKTVYSVKDGHIEDIDRSKVTVVPDIDAGKGLYGASMMINLEGTGYTIKSKDEGRFTISSDDSIYTVDAKPGMNIKDKGDGTLGLKADHQLPDVQVMILRDGKDNDKCITTKIDVERKESTLQVTEDSFVANTPSSQTINVDVQTQEAGEFTESNVKTDTEVNLKVEVKKIKSVKAKKVGKKKISLSWKKDKGSKGYEIQYSTDSGFVGTKTVDVTTNKAVIKKLQKRKVYYIRIRGYQIKNGIKSPGGWSKTKKVRM